MNEILALANSWPMWIFAVILMSIVVIQATIFYRLAKGFSIKTGILTKEERGIAIRTGVASTVGPALAVFFVAIGLITQLGGPITLMRVGVIGSAPFELMAANIGAQAYGVPLGGAGYNMQAFTTAVWVMTLGGMGWLVFVLFFAKKLGSIQVKMGKKDPRMLGLIAASVPFILFSVFLGNQLILGRDHAVALLVSAGSMLALQLIFKKGKLLFLRELALGISMIAGMAVATIVL